MAGLKIDVSTDAASPAASNVHDPSAITPDIRSSLALGSAANGVLAHRSTAVCAGVRSAVDRQCRNLTDFAGKLKGSPVAAALCLARLNFGPTSTRQIQHARAVHPMIDVAPRGQYIVRSYPSAEGILDGNAHRRGPRSPPLGATQRVDAWWAGPVATALGLGAFVVYATFRAFYNADYQLGIGTDDAARNTPTCSRRSTRRCCRARGCPRGSRRRCSSCGCRAAFA